MKNIKLLYKVLGIALLAAGIIFIGFALADLIKVARYNETLPPNEELMKANMLWTLLSAPCMFGGFFFFVLGFGKKKEYGKE